MQKIDIVIEGNEDNKPLGRVDISDNEYPQRRT